MRGLGQRGGLLGFFPELRDRVDVHYIEFPRPRQPIVELLGEENQSIPVLLLGDEGAAPARLAPKVANGRSFLNDERQIREYLSTKFALPQAG